MTTTHVDHPEIVTPPSELDKPEAKRTVYTLRTPSVFCQRRHEREVLRVGPKVTIYRVLDQLKIELEELANASTSPGDPQALAKNLQTVEEYREGLRSHFLETIQDDSHPINFLLETVRGVSPGFRMLEADYQDWTFNAAVIACRMFVTGYRNLPVAARLEDDGLADECLRAIVAAGHHFVIYAAVNRLFSPTEEEAKNSGSPCSGSSSPRNSSTASIAPPSNQPATRKPGRSRKSAGLN